ncbi:MAG: toprim domain-containing protein [Peptococcaceae bacterium]|nr:toprim domain-containing protein [Peptococcaceae bacterium]
MSKLMIVEGKSDKERLLAILDVEVEIVCTNGTLGTTALEALLDSLVADEIYVLTDADEAGNRLRRQVRREIPQARHLYTRKGYREVATTPLEHLAEMLQHGHFSVKSLG